MCLQCILLSLLPDPLKETNFITVSFLCPWEKPFLTFCLNINGVWLYFSFTPSQTGGLFPKQVAGADPGFFSGGGALVSCSTSTPINHIVFFLQNTSCIRKPQVISGRGWGQGAHPLHSPPRSAPGWSLVFLSSHRFSSTSWVLSIAFHSSFSNSLIIHKENTKDECLEILSWTTKKH